MENNILYHGSNVEVPNPKILVNGHYKDFFWLLVQFKYPTHQIVFCTEEALKTLHFEGSETL